MEFDAFPGAGVGEGEEGGVQGEAAGGFVGGAVDRVAADGVAEGFHLHADLVFAAGEEGAAEAREAFGFIFLKGFVVEDGKFSFFGVGGDVDDALVILDEKVFGTAAGRGGDAVDDQFILPGDGMFEELGFEEAEGIAGAGEDEEAAGVAVEAVDELDAVFVILAAEEFGEDAPGGGAAFLGIGGGEEAGGLFDHNDIGIEVEEAEALAEGRGIRVGGGVEDFELFSGLDHLFNAFDGLAMEAHAFGGDHIAERGFLRSGKHFFQARQESHFFHAGIIRGSSAAAPQTRHSGGTSLTGNLRTRGKREDSAAVR
jgi:hypothetical protein